MQSDYIIGVTKQFEYYKLLGDKTLAQLSDVELTWQYNKESNSIAIMVKHLWGNMMSRWTDFLTSDGEKEFRNRGQEFDLDSSERAILQARWEEGWSCLFSALSSITEEKMDTIVYIRNQGHTITEAINRQMMYYAYHVGQMVYLGRMIRGKEWESLPIPKGASQTYNEEKFSEEKGRRHFTGKYLEKNIYNSGNVFLSLVSYKINSKYHEV